MKLKSIFDEASRVGFGCASLGSRVSAQAGLRALSIAFESGVNWYDLAPSYGNGYAEAIFSKFSRGRRREIYICTKCGIRASRINFASSVFAGIARGLTKRYPAVRAPFGQIRPHAVQVKLSKEFIDQSLDRSLRRLRTDYVDVFALHDPEPSSLLRDDVLLAMEKVLSTGRARAIGIAGSFEAARAAIGTELSVSVLQIANSVINPQLERLSGYARQDSKQPYFVTHSACGWPGDIERISDAIHDQPGAESLLRGAGYEPPIVEALRYALTDYALQSNTTGTVLFSMFTPGHIRNNISRLNHNIRGNTKAVFGIPGPVASAVSEIATERTHVH